MVHLTKLLSSSCSHFLPSSSLVLRLTLIILLVSCKTIKGLVKLPADVSVPAVFVFGDSVVDTGNNNNRTTSFARSNFPPYGRDFQGGRSSMASTKERENFVYVAKLAEQAERYEGIIIIIHSLNFHVEI